MKIKDKNLLISSVLLILGGIAFLAFPVDSLAIVLRIIGGGMLLWEIYDIYRTVRAFKSHSIILPLIINNFFAILCSAILLINPVGAIRTLSLIIGIYLIVTSALSLYRNASEESKKNVGAIISSTVTLIVGFWLVISPFDMTKLTAIFIGAAVIIKGAELLLSSFSKAEKSDGKKGDYVTDDFIDKTDK